MPRQRTDLVRQYFKYRCDRNDSLCLANAADDPLVNYGIEETYELQCRKIMTGSKVSNLKYHIKSRHPRIYKELLRRNSRPEVTIKEEIEIGSIKKSETEENSDAFISKRTAPLPFQTRGTIIRGLLHLVTVNGRPFSIVEDSGFTILCGASMKEHNIRYNRRTIGNLVGQAADAIRNELTEIVNKYLLSVKVDCVTKFSRYYIGLHLQVNRNGQIVVFSLPVKEIDAQRTEEQDLKDIILKELAKYGISSQHIYSITSDTGANVLKPIKLIDEECRLSSYENIDQVEEDNDSNVLVDEILSANWEQEGILAVRCAAHCLQLAVVETLKTSWNEEVDVYVNLLEKARTIVKELRTPQQSLYLKRQNLTKPLLDVETRWSSTFLMVESFLNVKDYCTNVNFENEELVLSEVEWNKLDELRLCLEPFYIATKKLQDENLTLTDIYKILNICYMETSAIGTVFSQELVLNFMKHREDVMENILMLSAVYLDPRFSFELTDTQREMAIVNIMNIRQRLIQTDKTEEVLSTGDQYMIVDCNDGESRYELFLQAKHQALTTERSSQPSFEEALHSFQDVPRMSCKTSVLQFWEDNKTKYSPLYDVARIVHAVPGTQLSMIRVFNQLRYILNDQHSRLTPKNMENVVLVRSNFKHLKDSFFD